MSVYAGRWGPQPAIDIAGNGEAGLSIAVKTRGTNLDAVLYLSRDKNTGVAANPLNADAYGNFWFFAEPGEYDLVANGITLPVTVLPDPFEPPFAVASISDPKYGADPTGITDSTAAFNSAVLSGLPVFVPEGDYAFTNIVATALVIPSNTLVFGVGGKSKLHFTASAAGAAGMRTVAGGTNITIRDLIFYSNNVPIAGNTVCKAAFIIDQTVACSNIHVERCEFYYFYESAVTTNGNVTSNRYTVRDCDVHDLSTTTHANPDISAAIQTGTTDNVVIADNRIWNCGQRFTDWAIYIASTTNNAIIARNVIDNCSSGIQNYGHPSNNLAIANNVIRNVTAGSGIVVGIGAGTGPSNVVISTNTVSLAAGNTHTGLQVDCCSHVLIVTNQVNCGGSGIGILVNLTASDITVTNNQVNNLGTIGIQLNSTLGISDVTVHSNSIQGAITLSGIDVGGAGSFTRVNIGRNSIQGIGTPGGVPVNIQAGAGAISVLYIVGNTFGGFAVYGILIQRSVTWLFIDDNTGDAPSWLIRVLGANPATNFRIQRNTAIGAGNLIGYSGTTGKVANNLASVSVSSGGTNTNVTVANNGTTMDLT